MSVPGKRAADDTFGHEPALKRDKQTEDHELLDSIPRSSDVAAAAETGAPSLEYALQPLIPLHPPFHFLSESKTITNSRTGYGSTSLALDDLSKPISTAAMGARARLSSPGPFEIVSPPFEPHVERTRKESRKTSASKHVQPATCVPSSSSSQPGTAEHAPQVDSGSAPELDLYPAVDHSAASTPPFYVIASHAGAGVHSTERDSATRSALRASIVAANSESTLSAVCAALAVLEASPELNAGIGSNLTLDGHVECDASLMCGDSGAFGAVGALRGVNRPSEAARIVLEHCMKDDAMGRVPPLLLVGESARTFALQGGAEGCAEEAMITENARQEWAHWKLRWQETQKNKLDSEYREEREVIGALRARQDTVGAVAFGFSKTPTFAAGVSSGGLLLKSPGRVGEAAVYGAGTWADERIAVSVSGQGELIIKTALARKIAESVEDAGEDVDLVEVLKTALIDSFYNKWINRGNSLPDVGVLVMHKEVGGGETSYKVRLYCAFTTPSMAVAYATSFNPKPKAFVLRNKTHTHDDPKHPPFFFTQLPT